MTATPERWVMNAETTVTQMRPPIASFKIPPSDWQTPVFSQPKVRDGSVQGAHASASVTGRRSSQA